MESASSAPAPAEETSFYCTWGRELMKQSIEDAVIDIKKALSKSHWARWVGGSMFHAPLIALAEACFPLLVDHSAVRAARRLTLLYLGKAKERSLVENDRPMHEEIMSALGNLWFLLLPHMSEVRGQAILG
jgi:hypothetical protein